MHTNLEEALARTRERLTVTDVAKLLSVHVGTIWRWMSPRGVRGRRLASVVVGGRRYVLAVDLAAFLNEHDKVSQEVDVRHQRAAAAGNLLDAHGVRKC